MKSAITPPLSFHIKIFKNGHNQAIRIPKAFVLPGNEVIIHQEGRRLIIEPLQARSLSTLLSHWKPISEGIDVDDRPPESVDL